MSRTNDWIFIAVTGGMAEKKLGRGIFTRLLDRTGADEDEEEGDDDDDDESCEKAARCAREVG